ncbi:MAG TPA: NYN domain-containing protein [Terracidiphilus sp.]
MARLLFAARRARLPRVAVLIDADNVNQSGIHSVFEQLHKAWNPTYRRAYGRGLTSRAETFRRHGILPVEVVSNSPGKNAADIALLIDAMNELHARRVDAFCLVTGDGDFTRLAIAIRERGLPVLGFGGPTTPASLRAACTEFYAFENPADSRAKKTRAAGTQRKANKPVIVKDRGEFKLFLRNLTDGNGKATFQRINHEACKRDANFSARQYGARSLKGLIKDLAEFEVCPITDNSGAIRDYEVKLSEEKPTA